MFRLQPADTVAPGWAGVGGRERLGRADEVHARREHSSAETREQTRLRCASVLPLAAGARRLRSKPRSVT